MLKPREAEYYDADDDPRVQVKLARRTDGEAEQVGAADAVDPVGPACQTERVVDHRQTDDFANADRDDAQVIAF